MKKVKLEVEEKLTYRRTIIVEVPDEMSDSELENALDNAQSNEEFLDDFMHVLKEYGICAIYGWDDDLSSPDSGEVECDEYDFVEEEEE